MGQTCVSLNLASQAEDLSADKVTPVSRERTQTRRLSERLDRLPNEGHRMTKGKGDSFYARMRVDRLSLDAAPHHLARGGVSPFLYWIWAIIIADFTVWRQGRGVVRRIARTIGKKIPRAKPDRPRQINCPLCRAVISNHMGFIRRHVDEDCQSPEVQAIREYRAGKDRDNEGPAARIRCPDCPDRREFETPNRWSDHLCHVHGEWITYECDEENCNERFRTVKERNAHKRREHRVGPLPFS